MHLPEGSHCFLDPCAGDGEAVYRLADLLLPKKDAGWEDQSIYAVEIEKGRHDALLARAVEVQRWVGRRRTLHGDAFHARFVTSPYHKGATVLFLNPPYDLDPQCGRLEERFLRRYTESLAIGGALVFLVPFYALKASAETLATYYTNLSCFRFPGELFKIFKQVVLFANRGGGDLDPEIKARVEAWAADASILPELGPRQEAVIRAHPLGTSASGFETAILDRLDLTSLVAAFRPWHLSDKAGRAVAVEKVIPTVPVADLLDRRYPLAMPPKAAHIATGVAAGIFNGAVILPDDPCSGLPRILIKGCFDKEWRKVEEKKNKAGEVTAEVQVQAPKLVVTVLDLDTKKYHTLKSDPNPTFSRSLATMTTADLLATYGGALMRVLLKQCPVSYDPADPSQHFPLAVMGRPLFRAQEHVTRAAVVQLGGPNIPLRQRRHKCAFILGEIGSGKSFIALATLATIGARSTLILCPPHLLDSWKEQVAFADPTATCHVLASLEDVLAYAAAPKEGRRIALLSRETAKLGHAQVGVTTYCPACHAPVDTPAELARKRAVCTNRPRVPSNKTATLAVALGQRMAILSPSIRRDLPLVFERRVTKKEPTDEQKKAVVAALAESRELHDAICHLLEAAQQNPSYQVEEAIAGALIPLGLLLNDEVLLRLVTLMWGVGSQSSFQTLQDAALLLSMALSPPKAATFVTFLKKYGETSLYRYHRTTPPFLVVERGHANLEQGLSPETGQGYDATMLSKWEKGPEGWGWGGMARGSVAMAIHGYQNFRSLGVWTQEKVCSERLYQADPDSFRRVPLANFIVKRHATCFDSLILDEIQEYATEGSAQERAAHLLTEVGWPTLLLTGTTSNGYASSLFTNTWATDRSFRTEFDRDELTSFMDRYGYRKRLVQDKDKESGEIVAFGTHTDRVERSIRMTGYAPGILPLFVFRYLLKRACVIHKTDARTDIPELTEEKILIDVDTAQRKGYEKLLQALLAQMKQDQFKPDVAGKLFGALSELPSYLDRCSRGVGNQEDGSYQIRYPAELGASLVAEGTSLDPLDPLPKERWMINQLKADLAAGENVLIFGWHQNVLPRLKMLIERESLGVAPILDPARVPTAKRQSWIDKEIVKKGRRILVCNPTTVQTGLNNLVHFSRIYVMENPACNPIVYRQAIGRIDRIGQTRPTKVYFPVYRETLQEATHRLLLLKVAVSRATDGLDAEGALTAAGVGEAEALTSLSVGRALAEWLKQRETGLAP